MRMRMGEGMKSTIKFDGKLKEEIKEGFAIMKDMEEWFYECERSIYNHGLFKSENAPKFRGSYVEQDFDKVISEFE